MAVPAGRGLRRKIVNVTALSMATLATAFGLFWLVWILFTTIANGFAALSPKLLTQMTPAPGSEGGLLNAIFGSFIMIAIAVLGGAPVGILAGTWLAEFGRLRPIAEAIRFVNDILLSAPSIVIGLFVLPVVVRTTDETMRLVPVTLREAALALGAPQWRVIVAVIYPAARTGIVTGLLLGVARISGETAPLLFTALNNQYWTWDLSKPMANIPVVIFQFALSPYDAWHTLAWAGALIMTLFVLVVSVTARFFLRQRFA